jgi:hypothetical protein
MFNDIIIEFSTLSKSKNDYRKFGLTFAIIFLIIASFLYFKGNQLYFEFICVFILLILFGLIFPIVLKPFYLIWMFFGIMLGWFMTRLILAILLYAIITPISLLGKLVGKKFLEESIGTSANSYWNKREREIEINQNYEDQF